ncbi:X-X-X-Leu-X-X-Gly heptad repeat-containing protein [Bacillus sp. LL01]|uniref:X-X-X-Leu-X-X-Gly heptad repeat-containing protein n=1 Tax=Bacillus sp. LL01 TaxID=1665556 RepID=UPI00064D68E1|nr:X-X-X-Leu-X-X-Gly heptad repeat-containing protein [Bacillus sp. LL01]KMJ57614.1 X-X-X-Leu-X-X-Gly heptad repeat-containing protein [Bacillus sp. LL01]
MMRQKKILYVALAGMLFLPSFLGNASGVLAEGQGNVRSKEEVVYATLKANGDPGPIYVVNTLEVAMAGEILDFGNYKTVKNLTDMTELAQDGERVAADVEQKGKFYYQGDLEEGTELPWDVTVTYLLDGREVDSSELAGESGHVEIQVETSSNKNVDSVFYENYLLQVSLMLPNTYQNIETSSGGMQANAGKNKQITFTVMPGKEEQLLVEADVENFEFDGVEIAAVPSSLPIDTTGTEGMTDDMAELSDAIGQLNDGVGQLQDGVAELNNGSTKLRDGSAQYKNGINQLDGSSTELVGASNSIKEALVTINRELSGGAADVDLSSLTKLPAGLRELAKGLNDTADGLGKLQENYGAAYAALDGAISEIPAGDLSEAEIAGLYESGADPAVVDKLVANYAAAQKVKGTYAQVREAFAAVEPSLTQVDGAVRGMSGTLTTIADELAASLEETDLSGFAELTKGMETLAGNYNQFHSGLVSYTNGVGELSTSYSQLHTGLIGLTDGTSELSSGVGELSEGTEELYSETKDLPEKMQAEIDKMIQEYDKSDFKPVSFVSAENEKVTSVQFVIKTEAIKMEEKKTKEAEPEKKKGFWTLLRELFK